MNEDDELPDHAGILTEADLQRMHAELMKYQMPTNADGNYEIIVFLTLWEKIVSYLSPRLALKMFADRKIRNYKPS